MPLLLMARCLVVGTGAAACRREAFLLRHVRQGFYGAQIDEHPRSDAPWPLPLPLRVLRTRLFVEYEPARTPRPTHGHHGVQVYRLPTRVPLRAAAEAARVQWGG